VAYYFLTKISQQKMQKTIVTLADRFAKDTLPKPAQSAIKGGAKDRKGFIIEDDINGI
jgi:hypothetical protein